MIGATQAPPLRALLMVFAVAGCAGETATPVTDLPLPPVEARAAVDRAVATTGDVLTFQITVDHDPSYRVDVPEAGARIQGFRIVDTERHESARPDGRQVRELIYRLRADLVGSYILPSIAVAFAPGDAPEGETEGVIETSEIFVEVESVLPEDGSAEDIVGLKPLRPLARPTPWWWWLVGVAGLLVAGWLIWLYRRSRRELPAAPREPAHVVAFRELDALRATNFDDPVAVRRFYFAISETVRRYVEGRFGLNATDLTTEELRVELPRLTEVAESDREKLSAFLGDTDQVKFAEHQPTEDEIRLTYDRALEFVEATQPRAEEPEADEELAA